MVLLCVGMLGGGSRCWGGVAKGVVAGGGMWWGEGVAVWDCCVYEYWGWGVVRNVGGGRLSG